MCGRFAQSGDIKVLKERFHIDEVDGQHSPSFNISPGQMISVIIQENNKLVLTKQFWGMSPLKTDTNPKGGEIINARAESIFRKPTFKDSFISRRCLILASGFFEWEKDEGKKLPVYYRMRDKSLFAMAGIWSFRSAWNDDTISSFAIITTRANELVKTLHDRMPVILPQPNESFWLDPDIRDIDVLGNLLRPYPSKLMEGYHVTEKVNFSDFDDPSCIIPKAVLTDNQMNLF